MKIYLHPNGWPSSIDKAPAGLLIRERKGRIDIFLKAEMTSELPIKDNVFNIEGKLTTVTGKVTPVRLMKETENER